MTITTAPTCCVCDTTMSSRLAPWCFRCPNCGTWASELAVGINGEQHRGLDETKREGGLATVRDRNNAVIMQRLRDAGVPAGARLLDVGSAHGWFVATAQAAGFAAEGIEPDVEIGKGAVERGVPTRVGFFPDALDDTERFDVITYNDVLEHMPDARAALAHTRDYLKPGGVISVNIPNSRGIVYRAAALLRRIGVGGVFDRLWQVGLPSPHLWYFDQRTLTALAARVGLRPVFTGSLAAMTRAGLWQRAHFDRRPSPVTVASVAAGWAAAPVLNAPSTSDVMHLMFRRVDDAD